MEEFFPEQRWTSEGEPELGIGIVQQIGNGRVTIDFPSAGEVRMYSVEYAPLRRVLFKPGDRIIDASGHSILVEEVRREDNLLVYVGEGREIPESRLGEVSVQHGVEEQLLNGEVDDPSDFSLRRRTLAYDFQRRKSSIFGFVGGRIDLIPHQLYIAHEVSRRYAPRVLLSDEVGLGKTIEACLILHRLLLSGRISRAMVLVPESLQHQWFVELLRRFNLWFNLFDEARCLSLEESAPEGNPFLDDQLVLCSIDFLANSPKRARQALLAGWDMLVVDEAHHLQWSPEQASHEYLLVEAIAKTTPGLLLLTATPEQLGAESHFARLRLLDPDRYLDFDTFQKENEQHQATAELVEAIEEGRILSDSQLRLLQDMLGPKQASSIQEAEEASREELIRKLLDQYGPGRVIFRNTRGTMQGFPKRIAHLVPLQPNHPERWQEKLAKEYQVDQRDEEEGEVSYHRDPRLDWLLGLMEEKNGEKVLLICRTKAKVLALEEALRQQAHFQVGVFHEDLNIVQRDRNAAWFADPAGARLLICSEIGSEGRNFQFAHHLVLFDLPHHPELLEQRIGRLDRIGQTEDIHIHIPYVPGTPQECWAVWYQEGLQAFEKNLEGGDQIMREFGDQLKEVALEPNSQLKQAALASLVEASSTYQHQLRERLQSGRNRLLERNSFQPETASQLVEKIRETDKNLSLEIFMTKIFERVGVEMEDLAPRTFLLHPARFQVEAFPSIPPDGISVTFDRTWALSREEVSFLSWDHPMVTEAIDLVLDAGIGSASFGRMKGQGGPGILLEGMFVLETQGGKNLSVDRFMPRTPVRVVINHLGKEVGDTYTEMTIDQAILPGNIDGLLENDTFVEVMIPDMLERAQDYAEIRKRQVVSQSLQAIEQSLGYEIQRLEALKKVNPQIRPEEIDLAKAEKKQLIDLVQTANLRLDSLQLIQLS